MNQAHLQLMAERRDAILQALEEKQARPTEEIVKELAELGIALDGREAKSGLSRMVIARLTAVRALGVRTIIEVHADATFQKFYHVFTQEGRRWRTKKEVRTASRNEWITPAYAAYRITPGLERIAERFATMPQFTSIKIRIIKKRAYKRLINLSADQLGPLPMVGASPKKHAPTLYPVVIGKAIPVGKWLKSLEVRS